MAEPYNPNDFKGNKAVFYNLHAGGNGIVNEINHRMTPDTFNRFKGTAVLLHGYGASKEAMMITAIYFRALGMKTILPDLFGHGESNTEFKFAAKEHESLSLLLKNLKHNEEIDGPIILVGHSLGALPSINLLENHDQARSAILLAPMLRFDLAAERYLTYKAPNFRKLFSNQALDEIVVNALQGAHVDLIETDILNKAKQATKPILLITSDVDTVSPTNYFSSIKSDNVSLVQFSGRSHPSLIAFSSKDAKVIETWLLTNLKE